MAPKNSRYTYCVVILFSMVLSAMPGICFSEAHFKTAIIVSKKIKPYIHVVDGVTDSLAAAPTQTDVFFLSAPDNKPDSQLNNQIKAQLHGGQYDLVTAIGPEAAVLVWGVEIPGKKLYAAVLNPALLTGLGSGACGISLRIPVKVQLEKISQSFKTIQRIGLLFDPRHNQQFYEQALEASIDHGLGIIPLKVRSKNQIAGVLKEYKGKIDAIWMIPDQTIISEKIIHYVIKQGIYNNTGVIGYNSFFTRSGAFFSFEFDYASLGKQAGEAIMSYLETGECQKDTPVFNAVINHKMADKIGIRVTK